MKDPDISEVAKQSGVPASTLRYYEEKGLIASNGRRGLKRTFDPDVFEKLGLIALGRASGFTLDEIAAMMSPDGPRIDRVRLIEKADELDEKIRQLTVMRDGLRHASACNAPSHMECPSFRRILRAATAGRIGPPASALPAK
ncbi:MULTISPECIES: helix-turn-helix domain-containing protein [Hyphomonas]|uniref:MerR family transcriptional regulator n=1 Tax=Hyphomonas adhaerens TaxID=81029 RepID=A0A3B9H296_9PROT|nr:MULTISPECIES: helix-turn-helix domain-containing protein [Hyphomonas]MBB39418.1 MerR family transcriptional regulator [Hyphomonas sp.]HAE28768.1 MerR family transcriptional regulator [Hyphomonas adhaerens]|tara:strand:- start:7298 stop:7723 length:426 start_codon:yes stop_codon:yes gene_type:complete